MILNLLADGVGSDIPASLDVISSAFIALLPSILVVLGCFLVS